MTREQKIEELSKENLVSYASQDEKDAFKAGILAGIALRDAELLAMEFDVENKANHEVFEAMLQDTYKSMFVKGARWQHEQFMKAIKGDRDETK